MKVHLARRPAIPSLHGLFDLAHLSDSVPTSESVQTANADSFCHVVGFATGDQDQTRQLGHLNFWRQIKQNA